MCFIVKGIRQIAKKDIVVFKRGFEHGDFMMSQYYGFTYVLKELNRKIELPDKKYGYEINKGYHSYNNVPSTTYTSLHAFKCIIPKGTIYYENDNERVSENIIIVKKVNIFLTLFYNLKSLFQ